MKSIILTIENSNTIKRYLPIGGMQKNHEMITYKRFKKQRLVIESKKKSVSKENFIEVLPFNLFKKDSLINDIELFKFFVWKRLSFLLNILILYFNFTKNIINFCNWKFFNINWYLYVPLNLIHKNEENIFIRYIINSIFKKQRKNLLYNNNNNNFINKNIVLLSINYFAINLMNFVSISYQILLILILQVKIPFLVGYIIHSQIPSTLSTTCLHNEAENCFKQLFEKNTNICTDYQLHFQCKHYNFLDECFTRKDVQCPPAVVGRAASTAYKKRRLQCQQQQLRSSTNRRRHQYKSSIYRQNPPTDLQFISYIGYLQSICITNNTNCTSEMFRQDISRCEEDIKNKAPGNVKEANRHNLLRMKLHASSNLLQYSETKRDEECLLVRSSLTDIFQLHQSYCLQTSITRCMCERFNFEYFCNISCSRLEVKNNPLNHILTWSEFEGRLRSAVGFSQKTLKFTTQNCFIIFIIFFIIKNL